MSVALHSRTDVGSFPTVAVVPRAGGTREIIVGCRHDGRTWLVRYSLDLASRIEHEVTVQNVSDPPQHIDESRFLCWEMADGPVWPRWEIDLAELDPTWRDTGIKDAAGNPEARDGHVLSGGTAQAPQHEYDGQPLTFPSGFEPGEGEIAGDWILFRDHSNRRLARSKDIGATWDVLDVPDLPTPNDGVFEAAINSWGDVWYSPSGGQVTHHWNEPTGLTKLPPAWLQDGAAWAETPYCATCLYHAPTSRFFVYLRNADGLALTFERLNQWTWARFAWLDEYFVVLVTFAYGTMSIDVIDMRQPFELPVEPVPVTPPDPPKPDPPPVPQRELKLLVSTELGQAPLTVEGRVYDADPTRSLVFLARRQPETLWDVQSVKSPGDAQHFYRFDEAGTYDTRARQQGAVDSNIRTVTVVQPPPPPEPEPPPVPRWIRILIALGLLKPRSK